MMGFTYLELCSEEALEALGDQGGSFYVYPTRDEAKDALIDYIMHGRFASRN